MYVLLLLLSAVILLVFAGLYWFWLWHDRWVGNRTIRKLVTAWPQACFVCAYHSHGIREGFIDARDPIPKHACSSKEFIAGYREANELHKKMSTNLRVEGAVAILTEILKMPICEECRALILEENEEQ